MDLTSPVEDDTASLGTLFDCCVSLPDSGNGPFPHQSTHAETLVSDLKGLKWHPGRSEVSTTLGVSRCVGEGSSNS